MSIADVVQKLKGYHFTPESSWENIKQIGLWPSADSPIPEELRPFTRNNEVLWLYDRPQEGSDLVGVLIDIAVRFETSRIMCLEVDYNHSESLQAQAEEHEDVELIKLTHTIDFGPFGHEQPFTLLTGGVPPENIHPIGLWDFDNLLFNVLIPE